MRTSQLFHFPTVLPGLLAALVLVPAAAPAQGQALELTVLETSVEAHGVSPGGEVAWLGVSREVDERFRTHVTLVDRLLVDEDHDGVVTLLLERSVPTLAVWAAVDVTTGLVAMASPGGSQVRWAPEGTVRFRGQSGHVEVDLKYLQAILVRPGLGAFRSHLVDGGQFDAGPPSDGKVVLTPAAFRRQIRRPETARGAPVPNPGPQTPGPAFAGADILVGIDSRTLEVVLMEVE